MHKPSTTHPCIHIRPIGRLPLPPPDTHSPSNIPEPKCLGDYVDFTFSAQSLTLNNLMGNKPGAKKELRFSKAGVDAKGHSFDLVVSQTAGIRGTVRVRRGYDLVEGCCLLDDTFASR